MKIIIILSKFYSRNSSIFIKFEDETFLRYSSVGDFVKNDNGLLAANYNCNGKMCVSLGYSKFMMYDCTTFSGLLFDEISTSFEGS